MNTGSYVSGKIVAHWWRAPNWPPNQFAPYQVRLDNGQLIFVPFDDPNIVRQSGDPPAVLRFKIGTRVLCKVSAEPEKWEPGVVIASDFPLPTNANLTMPYQIKLDEGRVIFAPVDQDSYIRIDPDREGEEMSVEALNMITGKLRFKEGDLVECKIRPVPETWARGTITKTKIPHPQNDKIKVPYEILLHQNNAKIYAPADSDDVIRKVSQSGDSNNKEAEPPKHTLPTYRFDVGTRVECKMHAAEEIWESGVVMATNFYSGVPNTPTYPYQIKLDSGKAIVAPKDDDSVIRLENQNPDVVILKDTTLPPAKETSLDGDFFSENQELTTGIANLNFDDDIEELD